MIPPLYAHQKKIVEENRKVSGIFLGCGTGKTLTSLHLARGNVLIVAPKTTVEDKTWEKNLKMVNTHPLQLVIISKETFRRDHEKLGKFNTVIFDEVHTIAGLNPATRQRNRKEIPQASQLFEATIEYLERTKPERIYAVSATPIRSPMCVLGIAWILGQDWDFYDFRSTFYSKVSMGYRQIWIPRKDIVTKEKLGKIVQDLGYTGRMADFTDVPKQTFIVKHIPLTSSQEEVLKELPIDFPDPLVLVGKRHQVEQGILSGTEFENTKTFETGKLEVIEDLINEYPKTLIFAKYTEQIHLIENHIKKLGIPVYTLTGATKNRGDVLSKAESLHQCVVIAQSSISAGYELPSFRCTIYASQSYSFVDKEQSEWRTLRMNALDKNIYVYLISGKVDKAVYDSLENKSDFHEAIFAKVA